MSWKKFKYMVVPVMIIIITVWFLSQREEVYAGWTLRNETAVNPIAVCQDGAYFGVGGQNNTSSVDVVANIVPSGEVLFSEIFNLLPSPDDPLEYPYLTHSGYFYREWNSSYQPLPIGTEVNFGSANPFAGDVFATVGDCMINTTDVSSNFTYQGSLSDGSNSANGSYDFRFWLHDAETSGNQIGQYITNEDVTVKDGLFTTNLDFGQNVFNGQARWLEIGIRAGNSTGNFTRLNPRQALTATPYALSLQPGAVISGTLENNAILTLANNVGDGMHINQGYNGITIGTVNNNGIQIESAGENGIQIENANNFGVIVEDAKYVGISAQTTYTNSTAIVGNSTASTGYGDGVRGTTSAPNGEGVSGNNSSSTGGVGVSGYTSSNAGYGVTGFQTGYSTADNPAWESGGVFGGRNGIIGITKEDYGFGVYGVNRASETNGWAGRFYSYNGDGVSISTPVGQTGLTVSGGTKNAVVATDDGARLLYAEEATEVWFTDYGFGRLVDGLAVIAIDPIFAQTVNLKEPYHVFLQAYGNAVLYVTNRTATQFEVHLQEGDVAIEFSYRLVGKRLGYEQDRLERAPWADSDEHLYPDDPVNGATLIQGQQP